MQTDWNILISKAHPPVYGPPVLAEGKGPAYIRFTTYWVLCCPGCGVMNRPSIFDPEEWNIRRGHCVHCRKKKAA